MVNTQLNFGGFYGSIHEGYVDSMVSSHYSDDEGSQLDYSDLDIDYGELHTMYIKDYVDFMVEYMLDTYELNINFHNVVLDSPKFYNFRTDTILTRVSNDVEVKLYKLFITNDDFLEYVEGKTKSVSGFISFYSEDEVISNKDNIFVSFVFDYIIDHLTDEWCQYYDLNNCYENIHQINMPVLGGK